MSDSAVFVARRERLVSRLRGRTGLFAAGRERPRNFPKNPYPFRCSSHVLYLAGPLPPGSYLLVNEEETIVFADELSSDEQIWSGPGKSWRDIKQQTGADQLLPRAKVHQVLERIGRQRVYGLPSVDIETRDELSGMLGRPFAVMGIDKPLALAVVAERLSHDQFGVEQLQNATDISVAAHKRGMAVTRPNCFECEISAEMEAEIARQGMTMAYPSIVTQRGEVLHNHDHSGRLQSGSMLLSDVGAETPFGYASDLTRTWPVSGTFSPSQRALYEIVLAAQLAAIEMIRPGIRFRDVHRAAAKVIAEGLVQVGLLEGSVDALVERGAHALFFPHGIGHLLGLDVHDMEDLGDLSGYPSGRRRNHQFGLNYLRLDRDLAPGMVVTVEPGIYLNSELLHPRKRSVEFRDCLKRDELERFSDVRGIRIEDVVLVTEEGPYVMSAELPKRPDQVEALVGG